MNTENYTEDLINQIRAKVKDELPSKRYWHSIGVSYTAASLAMKYNGDINKARIAGILHDCAKNIDDDDLIKKCKDFDIPIRDIELENPDLLHAKLGSYLAHKKYDIEDDEILNAIKWHTTGHSNMTLLEKIIFVSDYIEPMRNKAKELDIIRNEAFCDLDIALIHILKNTLEYVNSSGKSIDENTKITYDYYREMNRMKSWKKH